MKASAYSKRFRRKHPVVEIHWMDAASTGGWHGKAMPKDGKESVACVTVGMLLSRTKREVTVATNSCPEHETTGEWMTVPAACVVRIRRLR